MRVAPPPLGPGPPTSTQRPRLRRRRRARGPRAALVPDRAAARGAARSWGRCAWPSTARAGATAPRDLRFAEVVADRVALALENAGLSAELLDVERRFEAIVDRMPTGSPCATTTGGSCTPTRRPSRSCGWASEELRALAATRRWRCSTSTTRTAARSPTTSSRARGRGPRRADPEPMLVRNVVRATGEERWLLTKATAIRDGEGRAALRRQLHRGPDLGQARGARPSALLAEAGRVLVSSLRHGAHAAAAGDARRARSSPTGAGSTCPGRSAMIEQVAVGHADPDKVALARDMRGALPDAGWTRPTGTRRCCAARSRTCVVDEFTDAELMARRRRRRAPGAHASRRAELAHGGPDGRALARSSGC